MVPVPVKFRVLNLSTGKDGKGQAIDIWTGGGIANNFSKKLATVAYATRSEPLTPMRSKNFQPREVNGKQVYGYSISYAPKGATSDEVAATQNGDAFPGDEMTIVITTNPAANTARTLSGATYYTKAADHGDGTHTTFQDMAVPAGSKLVLLDGHGLLLPAYDPSNPEVRSYDLASSAGCLPEIKAKGKILIDPNSRYTLSPDTSPDFAYVLKSDVTSVDVTKVPSGVSTAPQCSQKVATVDLPGSAGEQPIIFLYGDPEKPKSLVFPG